MPERRSPFARLRLERLESREVPTARAFAGLSLTLAHQASAAVAPPAAPPSFTATALSGTQAKLSWSDVAGEDGYRVFQWTGYAWANAGAVGANVTSFV